MRIEHLPNKLAELEINSKSPFINDKMKRDDFALLLNKLIEIYSDTGCVLAINGEWGTGKTTFVNMWLEYLNLKKYKSVYFNAWKTDYVSDPFVALVGELKGVIGDNEEFREKSSKVCRILLSIGKTIIKTKTGVDIDGVSKILDDDLEEYADQKTTFEEFKNSLEEYVASVTKDSPFPVIFVIDELDRCNPHYAVKVLERVKHLFDIPNIVFVLPISKSQLECSIKGFYGSNEIDAANYLRRFIDIEFELPKPPYDKLVNHLFEYHKFQSYFDDLSKDEIVVQKYIRDFKSLVETIFEFTNTEIRTMDKVFVLCRIVATQISGEYASEMDMIFLMCYIKLKHYDLYCQIRDHSITVQDLFIRIETIFPKQLIKSHQHSYLLLNALAPLLVTYDRNIQTYTNYHLENVMHLDTAFDKNTFQILFNEPRIKACPWSSVKEITDRIDLVLIPSVLSKKRKV